MNKKKEPKTKEISLLENPNMETQEKKTTLRGIVRIVAISLLLLFLFFGYIVKFSVSTFPYLFGSKFTGTFNASTFCNAKDGDLIIVKEYKDVGEIQKDDIICYATNLGKGSGVVVAVEAQIVEIETPDSSIKRLTINSIEGKQIKTISLLGYIVEFIGSYYGIIIFNFILIAYISYITFSRINYENTKKGKKLYLKYQLEKREFKHNKKLIKKVSKLEDINYTIVSMLEGNFEENKQKFLEFNCDLKLSFKEKYKYVLKCVYDAYLTKEELTKEEKKQISSVIELLCVCQDLDNDIEYMVVDLLLKTKLVDFDTHNFSITAIEFLKTELDDDDLLNLGSVLYVMLYKNKKLKDDDMFNLVDRFSEKANSSQRNNKEIVVNTATTILNLIK